MNLPILALLLASFLCISSHPKHSDIIPKDYYKRQILQPIPGYIPVYIKADGEPVVRSESKKHISNVPTHKVVEPKEKDSLRSSNADILSKNEEKKSRSLFSEKQLKELKSLTK